VELLFEELKMKSVILFQVLTKEKELKLEDCRIDISEFD